ncbi:hypothetical protein CUN63_03565 [Pseudomonas sp. ACM7]|nr:hypothetical protein CUN63_03565 [Pseudomonas sp. ACM7]
MGASLLAIALGQSTSMLNVKALSRAGSLPQRAGFIAIRNIFFHIPLRDFRCSSVLFRCSRPA